MKQITTPSDLMETVNAFRISRLILTAFELRIFDLLSGKSSESAVLADALKADPRATDRLLNALAGSGLITKNDRKFSNSVFSEKFLVSTSPAFMNGLGHYTGLWNTWSTLTEAVKTGKSMPEIQRNEINEREEEWLESFIAAMHTRGIAQGRELASMLDLSETRRTLDVGGGSGTFTFAFLERNPAIKGVIFDLPSVVPISRKYIANSGFKSNVTTLEGDYLKDDFGKGFDLVLMSAIIHINNPEENRLLIWKGAAAMEPGGQLVIMDHAMNEERTEPFNGALFSLNMLVGTRHGDTYTEAEIRGWMKEAGLEDIRLITAPSGMQMMTGKKTEPLS